ncbi:GNAT family N-acetyltransferase [Mucilaginibacter sp. E4BP6]|uniref:GNAT family N-acetyltransferase n=1 Tax=Mucilaginibacter sp. E4BP6 TaxID=2723089 RepID=UPI0015CD8D43|nr:GNAT family N-acetyltransferase [Mucilaginibacter sp. E4BP6]NYE68498.1 GNAT superfamily N-acetyltransferase [Mucilaginibacter sp. E4BP6]
MDNIIIRPATLADMDTLLRFEQGVITAERPFDPTLKDEHINYYDLVGLIERDDVELLVAELDGKLIGSGYARIEESKIYLKHPKHAYLGFMYVEPEHRGKGVNQKIIAALKAWASTQNVIEYRLQVYYDNLPAIKAYEKIGFSKLMIKMRSDII